MSNARTPLLWVTLLTLSFAGPATALPFMFDAPADGDHPVGLGFDPDSPYILAEPVIVVGPFASSLTAGDPAQSPDIEVTTALVEQPSVPATPSVLDPILATVEYTVTNTTSDTLEDAYLVFALAVLGGWPAIQADEFGIDEVASPSDPDEILVLLRVSFGGDDPHDHVFGAVLLPTLAVGAVHTFQLTHVVGDSLGASTEIPTPGLSVLLSVPEPPLALLVLLPLLALSLRRRP